MTNHTTTTIGIALLLASAGCQGDGEPPPLGPSEPFALRKSVPTDLELGVEPGPKAPQVLVTSSDAGAVLTAVARGPHNDLYVAGTYAGAMELGGMRAQAPAAGRFGTFVAKLPAGGGVALVQAFTHQEIDTIHRIAVGDDGVFIAGQTRGDDQGSWDMAVAKLGLDGDVRWLRTFGGPGADAALGLAIDSAGGVVVAGLFEGVMDLDGRRVSSEGGSDAVVVSLGADGKVDWVRRWGGASDDDASDIVASGDGLWVAGTECPPQEACHAVLRRLGPDGAVRWAFATAGEGDARGVAVATDGADAWLAGTFRDVVTFGAVASDSGSAFVTRVSAHGEAVWTRTFGGEGQVEPRRLAHDGTRVWVCGRFDGAFALGDIARASRGRTDAFVMSLSHEGTALGARTFGGTDFDDALDLVPRSAGGPVVVGAFAGTVNFGSGFSAATRTARGDYDGYLTW